MKFLNKIYFLSSVLVLAFILRFYSLGQVPASLNWDEVSNGYNAYSILTTLRDEYGNLLPLYNRSFEDYKPPLYMYLNIPAIKIFGFSELAVRLPSALFGVLSVAIFYLLVLRLSSNKKLALVATFLMAVSPWNMHFSRVGFESNLGFFMGISALTFLIYSIPQSSEIKKKHIVSLIFSAILFALSFYTYHSARIFLPIMVVATVLIFWRKIMMHSIINLIAFTAIPTLLIIPFFLTAPNDAISQRYKTVSLGAQKETTDLFIKYVNEDGNSKASEIIHNRKILILRAYLSNYLSHFNPEYLFLVGDGNLRHHTEKGGMLPLFLLPLTLIGLYQMGTSRIKNNLFMFAWLLTSPIPATPADAAPHAVRTIFMTVPILYASAVGISFLTTIIRFKKLIVGTLFVGTCFFLLTYLHAYYFHDKNDKAEFWMYGFKEAVAKSMEIKDNYPIINVDPSIEQGYIFWLFYTKYDPSKYQADPKKPNIYNFSFNDNKVEEGEMFISLADHYNPDLQLVDTIYYPNGKEAIKFGRKKYSWEK